MVPLKIMQNLRDLIILPKLQSDVTQWDPMTDPIPLHSWLHPWLEVVGNQLNMIFVYAGGEDPTKILGHQIRKVY